MQENPGIDIRTLPLPKLKTTLNLSRFENAHDGSPRWMLHDPVLNEYYQLGWVEFECIYRMHRAKTAGELIESVNAETALTIDEEDMKNLFGFLTENNLVSLSSANPQQKDTEQKSLISKILHGYLFFTIPLIKPQNFLDKALPYISPLLSKQFFILMSCLFVVGVILTAGRFDEFMHTFPELLTPGGLLLSLGTLVFIKIMHEFGHALVATKYGIPVPHMGIAFIIMYPILYTETTASWRIAERNKRLAIGLAGVLTELYLATFFLFLWNITPDPILQTLSVTVIMIALIGSLLVNLNPLMRFDGYYVISDMTSIENLQNRSFDTARWQIRKWLFDTGEEHPEVLTPEKTVSFMTVFGLGVLVYRFFLFLGIAILVYHLFFKPLGLFLMIVELWWFIGRPIWNELKRWWEIRTTLFSTRRAKVTVCLVAVFIGLLLLPINNHVTSQALLIPAQLQSIYPPEGAYLKDLKVNNRQRVQKGETLAVLVSDKLQHELNLAQREHERLLYIRSKLKHLPDPLKPEANLNAEIDAAKNKLENIKSKTENLIIKAPFDGIIADMNTNLHAGRHVSSKELLFRIKNTDEQELITFLTEADISRLSQGSKAVFYPDTQPFKALDMQVEKLSETDIDTLDWAELASVYGGDVPAKSEEVTALGKPVLRTVESAYLVTLKPVHTDAYSPETLTKGVIRASASVEVPMIQFFKDLVSLVLREINLN